MPAAHFFLKTEFVRKQIDEEHHLQQREFAKRIDVSRAYWSQLLNRRRPLTAKMRRTIRSSEVFADVPPDQIWERVPVNCAVPSQRGAA